jgi:hypothetical protein
LPEHITQELLRRLEEIHGFDLNPLLVTAFVASSEHTRTDIPANITELFKKYTEQMLGRWDENKGFAQQYQAPLKDFLLRKIAVKMHLAKSTKIPVREMKRMLSEELEKRGQEANTETLIEEIVYRSGLFRVIDDEIEFKHFLIQEFFAGRGMSELEVKTLVDDSWWQRCLTFYFGENSENQDLLREISSDLKNRQRTQLAQSSLTVGLALQACYLIPVQEKLSIYLEVLDALSRATYEVFVKDKDQVEYPLLGFVGAYVWGRDGVACNILKSHRKDIEKNIFSNDKSTFLSTRIIGI